MKKLLSLLLALVIVTAMTVVSYGERLPEIDLKGATATMTNSEGEDCFDSLIYLTCDEGTGNYMGLDALQRIIVMDPTYGQGAIMGYYNASIEYDMGSEIGTIHYRIRPQIKGFDDSTEFLLLSDYRDELNDISATYDNGEIVFDYDSNGIDSFVLVVLKDTLDPNGTEPAQTGNSIHLTTAEGIDGEGAPFVAPIMYFRTEDGVRLDSRFFSSITQDEAYYALISESDDVDKSDVRRLHKLQIAPMLEREELDFPITLNFTDPLVNSSTVLYPLHNPSTEEGFAWEIISYEVGDGTYSLTFDSFSPLVLYADGTTLNDYAPESPVTGDSYIIYVAIMGLIAVAGIGLSLRKQK